MAPRIEIETDPQALKRFLARLLCEECRLGILTHLNESLGSLEIIFALGQPAPGFDIKPLDAHRARAPPS